MRGIWLKSRDNFRKFISLVLLGTFALSSSAFAGTFVGNGGEGVEIGQKIELRDLFSSGEVDHPYLGTDVDPTILRQINAVPFGFDVPLKILAAQLSAINRSVPGLGDYLVSAIKVYSWTPISLPLQPVSDPDDPVRLPPGAQLVQIANRFQTNIRISDVCWRKMNDIQRVALILHEAVFSLLKPMCGQASNGCFQPDYIARELTADLFSKKFLDRAPDLNYQTFAASMNIPKDRSLVPNTRPTRHWRVWLNDRRFELDVAGRDERQLQDFAQRICRQAVRTVKISPYSTMFLKSDLDRVPYRTLLQTYVVSLPHEPVRSQIGLSITTVEPTKWDHARQPLFIENARDLCLLILQTQARLAQSDNSH